MGALSVARFARVLLKRPLQKLPSSGQPWRSDASQSSVEASCWDCAYVGSSLHRTRRSGAARMFTHVPANEGVLAQVWRWSEYFPIAFRQGALLGAGYAGALLLLRRRPRSVHNVSYISVGVIGGLAAIAATVVGKLAGVGVITGPLILLLGVTTSTLSLAIARRAPESRVLQSPDEPRLPTA